MKAPEGSIPIEYTSDVACPKTKSGGHLAHLSFEVIRKQAMNVALGKKEESGKVPVALECVYCGRVDHDEIDLRELGMSELDVRVSRTGPFEFEVGFGLDEND